ncbi:hypothetical protein BDN71DRAFT_1584945 [Pleurotus eryngii]|uniref:Uncharacterized protein n=1 Tax=Pleurotus eryngii TaxID=5323 RepID=A0A9P6ABQ1_PLEER|nr:hypothetical protein BDN71DRAFT_1584945 [Pleurotus eryngii]
MAWTYEFEAWREIMDLERGEADSQLSAPREMGITLATSRPPASRNGDRELVGHVASLFTSVNQYQVANTGRRTSRSSPCDSLPRIDNPTTSSASFLTLPHSSPPASLALLAQRLMLDLSPMLPICCPFAADASTCCDGTRLTVGTRDRNTGHGTARDAAYQSPDSGPWFGLRGLRMGRTWACHVPRTLVGFDLLGVDACVGRHERVGREE